MKKVLFVLVTLLAITMLTSCTKDFLDGYDAGYNGYTYIGEYSSESACSSACANRGYTSYRYNFDLENCYCK